MNLGLKVAIFLSLVSAAYFGKPIQSDASGPAMLVKSTAIHQHVRFEWGAFSLRIEDRVRMFVEKDGVDLYVRNNSSLSWDPLKIGTRFAFMGANVIVAVPEGTPRHTITSGEGGKYWAINLFEAYGLAVKTVESGYGVKRYSTWGSYQGPVLAICFMVVFTLLKLFEHYLKSF